MNVFDKVLRLGWEGISNSLAQPAGGSIFYVDGNSGNAANTASVGQGASWDTPFANVNYAISRCSNNAGDIILIAADHTETIADTNASNVSGTTTDEFCVDKSGITIIGLGTGTRRPKITLATATDACIDIRDANCTLYNLIFYNTIADNVAMMDVQAGAHGLLIENCMFYESANDAESLIQINLTTGITDVTIRGCRFYNVYGGDSDACIVAEGATTRLKVTDCLFRGDWTEHVVDADVAAGFDIEIVDNVFNQLDPTVGSVLDLHASTTGVIKDNTVHVPAGGSSVDIIAAGCLVSGNRVSNAEGTNTQEVGGGVVVGNATKTYINWTAAKHTLFNVVGPVRVDFMCGVVMATIKTATMAVNLDATTTDPGGDLAIASALDLTADAVGTLYTVNGTFGNALVATTIGAVADDTEGFFMNTGTITMESGAEEDGDGSIQWSIAYTALAPGAYIEPAVTD